MAETIFGNGNDQWVCPNDRQLALRAKLHTGWSVHTFQTDRQRKMQALDSKEMDVILEVIRRAEKLDVVEQQRIGHLVERLENMRKNVLGNGLSQCLLCGEAVGFLGNTAVFCQDCKKKVCTKCGIETLGAQKRPVWFCKICSEQREVWKRSGAWFYRGLPKCILPAKGNVHAKETQFRPHRAEPPTLLDFRGSYGDHTYTWARGRVVSSDSDSDSEISFSSLDDRSGSTGPKSFKMKSLQTESASSGDAAPSPAGISGRAPGSHTSESQSSRSSDRTGGFSAAESYPSDREEGESSAARGVAGKIHLLTRPWR